MWASLQKWHHALVQIPNKDIVLPKVATTLSLSTSSSTDQLFRAWQGDKLLGAAAARAVEKATDIRDPGDATKLISKALSNRFFATYATTLLPGFPLGPDRDDERYSQRQLGSMLEAAVAEVADSSSTSRGPSHHEAIAELAEWLVATANQQNESSVINPKGRLLELGGTVESNRIGGSSHQPLFESIARWKELEIVHSGFGSKANVEQEAAEMLLTTAINNGANTQGIERVMVEDCRTTSGQADGNPASPWKLNTVDDFSLKLSHGENTMNWWQRGAFLPKEAFRRAAMAPHLFFDNIISLECWSHKLYHQTINQLPLFRSWYTVPTNRRLIWSISLLLFVAENH